MFSLHTLLAHKLTSVKLTTLYTKRAFHKPLGEGEGEGLLLNLYPDGHSKPMFQKHNKNVAFILKQTLTDN